MGIQLSRVIWSEILPTFTFIYSFQDQPIEEKSDLKKSYEAFLESTRQYQNPTDSQAHHVFQIQIPYSIFKVTPQEEEPTDLERSIENMIQFENYFF